MPGTRPSNRIFVFCFVLLFAGLSLALVERHASGKVLDPGHGSGSYITIANHIVKDGTYARKTGAPTAHRPPAYPFVIAGCIALGESAWKTYATVVHVGLGATSCLLFLLLLRRAGGDDRALIAGTLMLLGHVLLLFEFFALHETALYLALSLGFLFALPGGRPAGILRSVLAAALATFAYLTRPTAIALLLIGAGCLLRVVISTRLRRGGPSFVAFVLTFAVLTWPWHLFQIRHFGGVHFFPSSNGGLVSYQGHNPDFFAYYPYVYAGSYNPWIGRKLVREGVITSWPPQGQDEVAADQALRRAAVDFIAKDPAGFVLRAAAKLIGFYSPVPVPWGSGDLEGAEGWVQLREFGLTSRLRTVIALSLLTLPFLFGAALFVCRCFREIGPRGLWPMLLYVAAVTGLHMITQVETRYRMAVDPILILLSALYWTRLLPETGRAGHTTSAP